MSGRKKVVFDNDNIQIYYPLSRDWCSYNEFWCNESNAGRQDASEYLDRLVKTTPGSFYILVKKENIPAHNQTYLMIGNRVPLKFDGIYSLRDDELDIVSIKKILAPHKEAASFLKLKYSFKERIKYGVKTTESEINTWAEKNEFSKIIKGIIDDKIHHNGLFSDEVDYLGEELSDYESYSYKLDNQVKIDKDGIELFIENDRYMTDVLDISEDDEYYYKMAMEYYYYTEGEEVDAEELDYMSCWFELDTIKKVDKLFTLFGIDKDSQACSDYDDAEINDFLLKHFPSEWERIGWDLLSEAGTGLQKERSKDAKDYIEDEVAFGFNVGNSKTTMEISFEQLLFLIWQYNLENLSGLLDQGNAVNQVESGLYDQWYDNYDFGTEAYEEIDRIFNVFLDDLLSREEEIVVRRDNAIKLEGIVKKWNFQLRTYNNAYETNIDNNSIKLYDINMVEGTLHLSKTVKQPAPDKPEETIPAGELMSFRREFQIKFEDISDYIDPDNIFADPTEEPDHYHKNIKTTP